MLCIFGFYNPPCRSTPVTLWAGARQSELYLRVIFCRLMSHLGGMQIATSLSQSLPQPHRRPESAEAGVRKPCLGFLRIGQKWKPFPLPLPTTPIQDSLRKEQPLCCWQGPRLRVSRSPVLRPADCFTSFLSGLRRLAMSPAVGGHISEVPPWDHSSTGDHGGS